MPVSIKKIGMRAICEGTAFAFLCVLILAWQWVLT